MARPKSTIFTASSVRIRLLGLMSRCTTPARGRAPGRAATCVAISSASSTGSGAALEPLLQRDAVVVGHHDEQLAVVGLVDVVDGADVRVLGGRGRLRFAHEALLRVLVVAPLGRQELQRHRPLQAGRAPCRPRPSRRPRAGDDLVVADDGADQRIGHQVVSTILPMCSLDSISAMRRRRLGQRKRAMDHRAYTASADQRPDLAADRARDRGLLVDAAGAQRRSGHRQPAPEHARKSTGASGAPSIRPICTSRPSIASAARFRAT